MNGNLLSLAREYDAEATMPGLYDVLTEGGDSVVGEKVEQEIGQHLQLVDAALPSVLSIDLNKGNSGYSEYDKRVDAFLDRVDEIKEAEEDEMKSQNKYTIDKGIRIGNRRYPQGDIDEKIEPYIPEYQPSSTYVNKKRIM